MLNQLWLANVWQIQAGKHPTNWCFKGVQKASFGVFCMILHFWNRCRNPVPKSNRLANKLESFAEITKDDLCKILAKSATKSSPLDPVAASLFKIISDSLLKTLTLIVNRSMVLGIVAEILKRAMISPILKKPHLNLSASQITDMCQTCLSFQS